MKQTKIAQTQHEEDGEPFGSPLRLSRLVFKKVDVEAFEATTPVQARSRMSVGREVAHIDSGDWTCELRVSIQGVEGERRPPYALSIVALGRFSVSDQYPIEKHEELVAITGASILYGACREMASNLTARSENGMLTLPSISFLRPPGSAKIPAGKKLKTKKSATT